MSRLSLQPPTEQNIQKAIIEYLLRKKILLLRINSSVAKHGSRIVRSVFRCGKDDHRGVSDLLGCTRYGKFIAIEVKKPGEYATPQQKDFLREVRENGGIALVAYSLADVIQSLEDPS